MSLIILICIALTFLLSIGIWALIGCLWGQFKGFFHRTYSFFDATFIAAYFIEQLTLLILLFFYPENYSLWVGIFAIIIITTASFQKLMWESRIKEISETTTEQKVLIERTSDVSKRLMNDNIKLKKILNEMRSFIEEELQKEG